MNFLQPETTNSIKIVRNPPGHFPQFNSPNFERFFHGFTHFVSSLEAPNKYSSIMYKLLVSLFFLHSWMLSVNADGKEEDEDVEESSTMKEYSNLREEMYSLFGAHQGQALLALQILDLVREIRSVHDSVKRLENRMDALSDGSQDDRISGMERTLTGLRSDLEYELDRIDDKVDDVVTQIGRADDKIDDVVTLLSRKDDKIDGIVTRLSHKDEKVDAIVTKLSRLDGKIDVMRSEVRLISQYKLTWQNSTWDDTYHADFVVDGVYTLSGDFAGINPVQHPGRGMTAENNMVIIDLGGIFSVHTVKLWNRIEGHQSYALGVLIYVEDELIGSILDEQRLYNVRAHNIVYGRKVYVKQSLAKYFNFIEIQVFGTGPYTPDELESFL